LHLGRRAAKKFPQPPLQNKFNKNLSFCFLVETFTSGKKKLSKMYVSRSEREVKYKKLRAAAAVSLFLPAIFIGPYSLHVEHGRSAKIDLSKCVI